MKIAQATTKHLSSLLPLFSAWYQHEQSYDANIAELPAGRMERDLKKLIQHEHYACFFAKAEQPVGLLCGRLARGAENSRVEVQAEVTVCYVAPEARKEGVASELLEAFSDWAKGHGASQLLVRVAVLNEGATRFYSRNLFEPVYVQYRKKLK